MLEHFPNLNLRPQTGTELLTVIDNKNEMKDRSKSAKNDQKQEKQNG